MHFDLLTIDDLGQLDRGRSRHRPRDDKSLYGGIYPFIQTGDIKHASFYISNYSQTYNEQGLAQSKLWRPGTLCITIAANIADTAILNINACFPDSILGFIPYKNKSDVRFVKYCFDVYKSTLEAISKGTTQDNLSLDKLRRVKFRIPSYSIQRKIAAVLSAYDDLIENNNRRIAILEKMAEELYREWFVRLRFPGHEKVKIIKGVPEGWEVVELGDICFEERKMIKKKNISDATKYIGLEHIAPKTIITKEYGWANEIQSDKLVFKEMDILFGKIRPYLHKVVIANISGVCSSDIIVIKSKIPESHAFIYLTVSSDSFIDLATTASIGTKMPRANWNFLIKQKILLPEDVLLAQFQNTFNNAFGAISNFQKRNEMLQNTRDRLLSRLMSGKIDVGKLDIHFPASMQEEVAVSG
jgi:type I restriction enzyme S subunit